MSKSFLNRFVQKLGSLGNPRGAAASPIEIAAFGKHPGWDDHVPEVGLTHPALIDFKRWLYDGITRNVDNGQWDNLQKTGQLQPFAHTLLWFTGEDWIAARCWQSADGKGRDRYPMIAAAICSRLPLSWVVREAVPCLKMLQEQCTNLKLAAEVRELFHAAEAALRQGVPAQGIPPDAPIDVDDILQLADRKELGPDRLGFFRLLYHIEREVPQSKPPKIVTGKPVPPRPFTLRVPPCVKPSVRAAEMWARFLLVHPDIKSDVLISAPDHGLSLDLMVGIPGASQLYVMRAPEDVVPFTIDVPYTLDAQFGLRVNQLLKNIRAAGNSVAPEALSS